MKRVSVPGGYVPELKAEIQGIWDKIDPRDFRYYTERLSGIMEDIIKVKGGATIN